MLKQLENANSLIAQASEENGIQQKTLRAAALELGARNPSMPAEDFIRLVRQRARDAATQRKKLKDLEARISALDASGDRTKALALLRKAQAAFDDGRLEEAEEAFGQLSFLRGSELTGATVAWLEASQLQAKSAALRGATDVADRILEKKSAEVRLQKLIAQHAHWELEYMRAEIWQESGTDLGKPEDLKRALSLYQNTVLPMADRDTLTTAWASTQNAIGMTMSQLALLSDDEELLKKALQPLEQALAAVDVAKDPTFWSTVEGNRGATLTHLGQLTGSDETLNSAVTAMSRALDASARDKGSVEYARNQINLATAKAFLKSNKNNLGGLKAIADALQAASQGPLRSKDPRAWAGAQHNRCIVLQDVGVLEESPAVLEQAAQACRAALSETSKTASPVSWAWSQVKLAEASRASFQLNGSRAKLLDAIKAYQEALLEFDRVNDLKEWARLQNSLGELFLTSAQSSGDLRDIEGAIQAFRQTLTVRTQANALESWATAQINLGSALAFQGDKTATKEPIEESARIFQLVLDKAPLSQDPGKLAALHMNQANSLRLLAVVHGQTSRIPDALQAYRKAQVVFTQEKFPGRFNLLAQRINELEVLQKALLKPHSQCEH